MEVILIIIAIIAAIGIGWFIIHHVQESIMYFLAGLVGSKKRWVGVLIFWIIAVIVIIFLLG